MFGRISFCVYLLKLIGPSKQRRYFLYGLMYVFRGPTLQYASFTGVMSLDSCAADKVQKSSDPLPSRNNETAICLHLDLLRTQHIIINVLTIILVVVQCPKFATLWDPIGTPGKCWSPSVQADFGFFQGATNTITDLILTAMPATIVWKLQIAQKLKTGLSVLLGLSLL
jgi:hypothetical protein